MLAVLKDMRYSNVFFSQTGTEIQKHMVSEQLIIEYDAVWHRYIMHPEAPSTRHLIQYVTGFDMIHTMNQIVTASIEMCKFIVP